MISDEELKKLADQYQVSDGPDRGIGFFARDGFIAVYRAAEERIKELEARIENMREALLFYACAKHITKEIPTDVGGVYFPGLAQEAVLKSAENGYTARTALAADQETK